MKQYPDWTIECDGTARSLADGLDMFVVVDGVRIAKCVAETPDGTRVWAILAPGYIVRDGADYAVEVEYCPPGE